MKKITRKEFLKGAGYSVSALALSAITPDAFATDSSEQVTVDSVTALQTGDDQISPASQQIASGIDNTFWDNYDVKFEFVVSADVEYNSALQKYVMKNVSASNPTVIARLFSGAHAVAYTPTISTIDGGRTTQLSAQAVIQNSTGFISTVTTTVFLYCDSNTGELTVREY